ncbi:GTP cyclohydrolase II [Sphingomonas vulcanisoli]|uniref:GTP cyclohydrolase-2 n=1 Tax=Sphingomonas vulcanisoli TaxID=1658060 RepID=A0ABX0TUW4_9SPHN|nr:GTP cyclohydrolase II [Sphingomonas vulcanisoli]
MTGDPKAAARAIDAIRRGWPIRIAGDGGAICLLAIETADEERLAGFDAAGMAGVLLSAERAATLKLANQRDAATPAVPVLIGRAPWLDLPGAVALADPSADLSNPFKGPYQSAPLAAGEAANAALALARLAGVLPAFFLLPEGPAEVSLAAADVAAIEDAGQLRIVTRARLPIEGAEQAEIVAFRGPADAAEHVALLIGAPTGQPPIVRLHSECLTGDAFGSLKCDCGPQLDEGLRAIAASGWGILLYLRQEGRGIGLVNKLRAYALQDQGFDTLEANRRLGFAEDARDFGVAARMLALLNQDRIRLLTNNPEKVAGLARAGIEVIERLPLALPANPHNQAYLGIKRDKAGHFL